MADLVLDDVTKRFSDGDDEIVAVDSLSLDIPDGEFLVIVGPSGCGKTTTLRMMAGLETVTEGEIRLGGNLINDEPPQRRDIAMVFQSYALYPHMTVRGNMSFGLEESTDLPDDDIASRVEQTATMLEIHELLDRKPGELSGGQQQRVALGRAIVRDPEVFLLDEPLSNLDAKLRSQMRTELQRLQEDLDTTTIYVTHDQTEAMTMGDRIVILNRGELQQVGTPYECYHSPANVFVAGFIGEPSMNLVDADRDGDVVESELFSYRVSEELAAEIGDATELVVGIRPDAITLRDAVEEVNDFTATVDVVEPVGKESHVYLTVGEGSEQTLVATVGGNRRIDEGQTITVQLPEEALHVFERSTGRALRNREFVEEAIARADN